MNANANANTNTKKTILTIVLTAPTGDQYRQEIHEGETLDGGFCHFRQTHIDGFKWEIETEFEKESSDEDILWYLENLCADDEPAEIENFYALGLLD